MRKTGKDYDELSIIERRIGYLIGAKLREDN